MKFKRTGLHRLAECPHCGQDYLEVVCVVYPCRAAATCGLPFEGVYRQVCGQHFRELERLAAVSKENDSE